MSENALGVGVKSTTADLLFGQSIPLASGTD
jgi:hypothetical protein